MNDFENQIKHIEGNILLKEKKIKILEKDINELKYVSEKLYNELITQEKALFQKKMESISWDLKINKLKKENVKIQKQIEQTNMLLHSNFHDLKNKKVETEKNKKKINEISSLIKLEHLQKENDDDVPYNILQNFLSKKKEHNNNLQKFIKKKDEKIAILENKRKTLETLNFSLCQEIGILNEEIIYNLNKIRYFVQNEINRFIFRRQQLSANKSNLITSLNIIINILEKEKLQNQLFSEKYKYIFKKNQKEIFHEEDSSITHEINLELGAHTKEFLELENFYS